MNRAQRDPRPREAQAPSRAGASVGGAGLRGFLRNYLLRHLQVFFASLGQLARRPVSTLMTAAVLGIALALPAGLHLLLQNVQQVTSGWEGATRISLFLKHEVSSDRAHALARELTGRSEVRSVRYISPAQALEEFRELSGFGDALDALESNPLPAVLVVRPQLQLDGPEQVAGLVQRLRQLPEVDMAQLDMQWVKRLYALMDIGRRAVWVLASLLALAVLLVVGNTIRLAIQNRRDEIVITKLIGATDAFIRRPFLYTGFWYGMFGGTIAYVLVATSLWLLQGPVRSLATLYHSTFRLEGLDLTTTFTLLGAGALLGLLGSWFAVARHLRDIEPT
jgi:cell division transport system permease protein